MAASTAVEVAASYVHVLSSIDVVNTDTVVAYDALMSFKDWFGMRELDQFVMILGDLYRRAD